MLHRAPCFFIWTLIMARVIGISYIPFDENAMRWEYRNIFGNHLTIFIMCTFILNACQFMIHSDMSSVPQNMNLVRMKAPTVYSFVNITYISYIQCTKSSILAKCSGITPSNLPFTRLPQLLIKPESVKILKPPALFHLVAPQNGLNPFTC